MRSYRGIIYSYALEKKYLTKKQLIIAEDVRGLKKDIEKRVKEKEWNKRLLNDLENIEWMFLDS